jgi:ABC-type polysaccharide/polyol phosphate export permease
MREAAGLSELWRFREVIKNFVSQDLKVKYRRSALGFFWSLMNPLLQMLVLSLVFKLIFKMPSFTLYLLAGLIPWNFFATSIDACSTSIINSENMLKRQYFPKLVFPLSAVIQNLITFVLSLTVLLVLVGPFTHFRITPALAMLPLSIACLVCFTLGIGAIAAVLTVHFRDMQHLIGVLMSALFYLTPIIYPLEGGQPGGPIAEADAQPAAVSPTGADASPSASTAASDVASRRFEGPIPQKYRGYFKLNPMYAMVSMFQRPIYYDTPPTRRELATALGASVAALLIGLAIFRRAESTLIFRL